MDTRGFSRPRFDITAGVQSYVGRSARLNCDLHVSVYRGIAGTRNDAPTWSSDVAVFASAAAVSGEGNPLPRQTLNSSAVSAFSDTSSSSFLLGGGVVLNSATSGITTHHTLGFRAGDFSLNYQNDMGVYPGLPLGKGTDHGHTASAIFNVSTSGNSYIFGGYEQFTGRPISYEDRGRGWGYTYRQTGEQKMHNRANHIVGFGDAKFSVSVGFSGDHSGQNFVHKYISNKPDYEQTDGTRLGVDIKRNTTAE